MKDDIIIKPVAGSCLTDSFDDRVANSKVVEATRKRVSRNTFMIGEQEKRIDVHKIRLNKQAEFIKELKEECRVLRARTESARFAIEFLHDLIDNELKSLKWFSIIMPVLFFLMLVVIFITQFVGVPR